MVRNAFQGMNELDQGICILNAHLVKVYENDIAKKIFKEKCPKLYQQFKALCRNDRKNETKADSAISNSIMTHSGTLHYPYGTVVFHCAALGEGSQTCTYIIFEFISELGSDLFDERILTPREKDILHILAAGKTNKEISAALGIGTETVKSYIRKLFIKTGTNSRVELVGKVLQSLRQQPHDAAIRRQRITKKNILGIGALRGLIGKSGKRPARSRHCNGERIRTYATGA